MSLKLLNQKEVKSRITRQWNLLPGVFFKTESSYFIFDFNKINFLEVNELVYKLLSFLKQEEKNDLNEIISNFPEYSIEDVQAALNDIAEIQEQGFLISHEFQRATSYTMQQVREYLSSKLQGLYLNITSRCNLACNYCIFGGSYENVEHLSNRTMPIEIADKAIEFFKKRAQKEGELRVDFFGGEPMLEFPLIEHVVYTLKPWAKLRNQELKVSISSNGTIMNDKILDFLICNNVYFQISMDGEKEIHDAKRKYKNSDVGSFDIIMRTIQLIYNRNPEYFKTNLRLKSVLTTDSLNTDGTDFFNNKFIQVMNEKKHFSILNQTPHYDVHKDHDFFLRLHILGKILLKKSDVKTIEELLNGLDYKKKFLFYATFVDFFNIQIHTRLTYDIKDAVPFKKNCLIGAEGCVNVNGDISICYKANNFKIGSVIENTWYFDKIEDFHNNRYSKTARCKKCFIQRFCSLCYEKLSGKENRFEESFKHFCEFNREYHKIIFQYMLQIVENNPDLWDELQRLAEKERETRIARAKAQLHDNS